ncbi:MAG: redox-sensing transcriptional repressor Rex [Calditrichaeota bacterium]|nr:redox-sensing transcriptional repressor Rex [Calditrichota bacterium]
MESKDRIKRLLDYKNLLYQLQSLGFVKVFSDNIADAMGISSSLVRKDFAVFGIVGSQKGGYEIESIIDRINQVLGKNEIEKIIIVGVGRIGQALMQYSKGFREEGIRIIAGFDSDPTKMNGGADIPVFPINELHEFVVENKIKFAIVAVPETAARATIEILKQEKIQGILNFTSLSVKSTDETTISNVDIEHELAQLIYFVNNRK